MEIKSRINLLAFLFVLILSATSATAQSWTKLEGGHDWDEGKTIESGNQNSFYTLGNYQYAFDTAAVLGIAVAKYDTTGSLQWLWHPINFNSGQAFASDLALDNSEKIYFTGMMRDSVQIGDSIYTNSPNSFNEFYISKIDSAKNNIWTLRARSVDTTLMQANYSNGLSIEINKQNKLYVEAEFSQPTIFGQDTIVTFSNAKYLLKLDTSGTAEWIRSCNCDLIEVDTSGNYYTVTSNLLQKFDDSANLLWQRMFNSPVVNMDLNDWDIFYVITDTTLHKINLNSGADTWSIPIQTDFRPTISSDSTGMVIVGGENFPASPPYYVGSYFEEYSSTGNFMGYFTWGNPLLLHNSIPKDIVLKNNGSLLVLGDLDVTSTYPLTSVFVFGNDTFPNIGNFDTYISKIRFVNLLLAVNGNSAKEYSNFLVYPNPTNNFLFITHSNTPTKTETIKLFDLFGRMISSTTNIERNVQLDLSHINSGIYMLAITNEEGTFTKKIIKQ